jgi:hypothetical protein
LRASKLVAAPFATPPLLACDEAEPDAAATAAPGTVRKIGDHQDAKQWIPIDYIKSDISPLNPPQDYGKAGYGNRN